MPDLPSLSRSPVRHRGGSGCDVGSTVGGPINSELGVIVAGI